MTSGRVDARILVGGTAHGDAFVLEEPLSFWGGLDPVTGDIVDRHHPQHGVNVSGRILVMPSGRGSSSSSSVLAEAIRLGKAPAAVVLSEADGIVALGAIVAEELYARTMPVVVVPDALDRFATGARVSIEGTGIRVEPG